MTHILIAFMLIILLLALAIIAIAKLNGHNLNDSDDSMFRNEDGYHTYYDRHIIDRKSRESQKDKH